MVSNTLLAVFAVNLLAASGDITQTWTSAMFPKLKSNDTAINPLGKPLTSEEDAWMGSILNIGAMLGSLPFGFLADRLGRKLCLLSIAIPHIVSYVIYAFSTKVYLFYFGRFINGFSLGAGYTLLPLYIAEVSKDSNRGTMSVTLNLFWTLGNFLPVAIGPYLSLKIFNVILAGVPITFFVLFLFFGVETPYYYVRVDKIKETKESLKQLRSIDDLDVQKEIEQIKANFKQQKDLHWSDIFKNQGLRKALIISLLLILFQELSGIGVILYYMQLIFEASGSKLPADLSSTICGAWTFLTSTINMFSADRIGRKIQLISSCFLMAIALGLLGAFFYLKENTDVNTDPIFWLPICCLLFYLLAYDFGMCVMPWTISSELFPSNVKRISAPAVSLMCWFASFIITKYFDGMVETIGRGCTFWMFSGFCILGGLFTMFYVPETNGKSFGEIQSMLVKHHF